MATLPPGVGGAVPLVVAEAALGLLFRFSQDQGSSGADIVGGWWQAWRGCFGVSGVWWWGRVWDVPLGPSSQEPRDSSL